MTQQIRDIYVEGVSKPEFESAVDDLQGQIDALGTPVSLTQSITNGNTTEAPSSDAVFDAIKVVQDDVNAHEARTDNPHSVTKAQVGLQFADNTSDLNKPVSTAQAAADLDALNAAKAYADALNMDGVRLQGNWDPSVTVYPNTGGSGAAGAIKKGDKFEISVAANGFDIGDQVTAKINNPGQTASNWITSEHNTQQATTSERGTLVIATNAEAVAGTNTQKAIVPSSLAAKLADWLTNVVTPLFQLVSGKDASNGYVGLNAYKINFKNATNTFTSLLSNTNSAIRNYIFPDKNITVAGVDDVYFILLLNNGVISPSDLTTYYFGLTLLTPTAIAANHQFKIGYDVVVVGAIVSASLNTIQGSTEDSTMKINNLTTGVASTLGLFKTNAVANVSAVSTTMTGLNIPIAANDLICGQWDTPNWATNPTTVRPSLYLILRRA